MEAQTVIAMILGIMAILSGFYGGLRWVIKAILKELQPNGGTSLRDEIDRQSRRLDMLYTILQKNGSFD
ncbi:hypothetical protein UFOVP802_18 [uncultured Caudovirales phage]|uniref:Uncharacterized protein n=1 Tax=uncultured Caudovirales phage TaxID=2100421 RepID=A0A6J5P204_9CAUD|nr:hypothetical protein UFOVP802_18 [uncultured Caudovirales phage]